MSQKASICRLKNKIGPWIDTGEVMDLTAVTTPPTKGTAVIDKVWYRRIGDSANIRWTLEQTAPGVAGSGDYIVGLPAGFVIDTSKFHASTYRNTSVCGMWGKTLGLGAADATGIVWARTSKSLSCFGLNASSIAIWSSGFAPMTQSSSQHTLEVTLPILGWG